MSDRVRALIDDALTLLAELKAELAAPPAAKVRHVVPGLDLTDILATMPPDVVIELAPGDYGPMLLPPHSGTEPRVIRGQDARVHSATNAPALRVVGSRYLIQDLTLSCADPSGEVVLIGDPLATRLEDLPEQVALDRCNVHGDPHTGQKRGIAAHGRHVTISRCTVSNIMRDGQDSQAIYIANGGGPYRILENYLEASGENILIGGDDARIQNGTPTDIHIIGNHLKKPLSWTGQPWDVKNLLELKHARHVLITSNILEGCWKANQDGYAVMLTPRNQGGGNPWAVVEDVLIEHNLIRNVSSGFNLAGYDDEKGSQRTNRITIRQNLILASRATFGGDGRFLLIGGGPRDVTIEHNTAIVDGNMPIGLYRGKTPYAMIENFALKGNVFPHNLYGIMGDNTSPGIPALLKYVAPPMTVTENAIGGGKSYPAGNFTPSRAEWEAGFVDYAGGDYRIRPEAPWAGRGVDHALLPTVA
jgi:hypothetical protein